MPAKHPKGPPNVPLLLETLAEYEVSYVLIGSVAAQVCGVSVAPGDLDITPDLATANLERLAAALRDLEAWPDPDGAAGHWEMQEDGERRWVVDPLTPERIAARLAWTPDPEDIASFDHLFHTRYGNLDVVPDLIGTFDVLIERAVEKSFFGHDLSVASIGDLLAALTVPRRKKDADRVRELRVLQRTGGK